MKRAFGRPVRVGRRYKLKPGRWPEVRPTGHHGQPLITDQHPARRGRVDRIIGVGQDRNDDQVVELPVLARR